MIKSQRNPQTFIKNPATTMVAGLAADEGFEPSQTESESVFKSAISVDKSAFFRLGFAFVTLFCHTDATAFESNRSIICPAAIASSAPVWV